MGYETELQFTEVVVDKKRLPQFRSYVDDNRDNDSRPFHYMLRYVYLDTNEHGYLDWNLSNKEKKYLEWLSGERPARIASKDLDNIELAFVHFCAIEEESIGKWSEIDAFVEWLSSYCISGRIIEISREGDGAIRGWEFDRRRRYRELGLAPVGKWRSRSKNSNPARRNIASRAAHK